jgi:hypothetical protein
MFMLNLQKEKEKRKKGEKKEKTGGGGERESVTTNPSDLIFLTQYEVLLNLQSLLAPFPSQKCAFAICAA